MGRGSIDICGGGGSSIGDRDVERDVDVDRDEDLTGSVDMDGNVDEEEERSTIQRLLSCSVQIFILECDECGVDERNVDECDVDRVCFNFSSSLIGPDNDGHVRISSAGVCAVDRRV